MPQATTHQVRQILMNELGLTRESIRAEAGRVIEAELKKVVRQYLESGGIQRVVREELASHLNTNSVNYRDLVGPIREAVLKHALKTVEDQMRMTIEFAEATP